MNLRGSRRYFAEEVWRERHAREPIALFVCPDRRAEDRVPALADAPIPGAVLMTDEQRYQDAGTLGEIWRGRDPGRQRLAVQMKVGDRRSA